MVYSARHDLPTVPSNCQSKEEILTDTPEGLFHFKFTCHDNRTFGGMIVMVGIRRNGLQDLICTLESQNPQPHKLESKLSLYVPISYSNHAKMAKTWHPPCGTVTSFPSTVKVISALREEEEKSCRAIPMNLSKIIKLRARPTDPSIEEYPSSPQLLVSEKLLQIRWKWRSGAWWCTAPQPLYCSQRDEQTPSETSLTPRRSSSG
jgi:hypothetical protein